jgi:hypothetical protein
MNPWWETTSLLRQLFGAVLKEGFHFSCYTVQFLSGAKILYHVVFFCIANLNKCWLIFRNVNLFYDSNAFFVFIDTFLLIKQSNGIRMVKHLPRYKNSFHCQPLVKWCNGIRLVKHLYRNLFPNFLVFVSELHTYFIFNKLFSPITTYTYLPTYLKFCNGCIYMGNHQPINMVMLLQAISPT